MTASHFIWFNYIVINKYWFSLMSTLWAEFTKTDFPVNWYLCLNLHTCFYLIYLLSTPAHAKCIKILMHFLESTGGGTSDLVNVWPFKMVTCWKQCTVDDLKVHKYDFFFISSLRHTGVFKVKMYFMAEGSLQVDDSISPVKITVSFHISVDWWYK